MKNFPVFMCILAIGFSCKQSLKTQNTVAETISVPVFNADSAYYYTATQVSFGPRVLGTNAHEACGNYLSDELKRFGATVTLQETTVQLQDQTPVRIKNIIGSFQPENKSRILLFAHWDTRPFADHDPNPDYRMKPIDGANDGAGACAALLEIARQAGMNPPTVGVDIIFFDMEDWGSPNFTDKTNHYGDWCMGSDYWARNPHVPDYTARYGILLDMVSAPDAQFYKEIYSEQNAPSIVKKVWEAARATGYDSYFIDKNGSSIMDDHVSVISYRKIPCIDIIHCSPNSSTGFGSYWHTTEDNMNNVSKETLTAVGQTILYVLYHEK
ncbi:MAG: M28 family peptidase [Candidatus Azobacteroides sp.]|nr:M28 family peptidase [Candidatus Azobacteroides sp.]